MKMFLKIMHIVLHLLDSFILDFPDFVVVVVNILNFDVVEVTVGDAIFR